MTETICTDSSSEQASINSDVNNKDGNTSPTDEFSDHTTTGNYHPYYLVITITTAMHFVIIQF